MFVSSGVTWRVTLYCNLWYGVCMYGGKSSRLIDDLLLNITCVDVYVCMYMRACACNSFRVTINDQKNLNY